MAGISLEPLTTADPCPRVGVTVDGLDDVDESVITVWRSVAGEPRRAVRGLRAVTVVDATFVVDHEAPLGREVTYTLEVTSGAVVPDTLEATVTVASDDAWLQDPLEPSTAVALSAGELAPSGAWFHARALSRLGYGAQGQLVQVLGAQLPTSLGARPVAPSGVPFDVVTDSIEACNRVRLLIESAAHLLLRTVPAISPPLPSLAYLRAEAAEQPVTALMGGTLTVWSLTGDLVQPPSVNLLVPTWTYEQVAALWETYAEASASGRTYLDWMKDPTP